MLDQEKKEFLIEKVRREFLLGKLTTSPVIPTSDQIEVEVNRRLRESQNDILGVYKRATRKGVSSTADYNNNMLVTRDNLQVMLKNSTDTINDIVDLINNSTAEKNNAQRELKKINERFKEIDSGKNIGGELSYNISDSFTDAVSIDLERSTVDANFNTGSVSLSKDKSRRLQFPHLLGKRSVTPTITIGRNSVIDTLQVPNTTWGAVFSRDDTDRWEYVVQTDKVIELETQIIIKLLPDGAPVVVNEVVLNLTSSQSADSSAPNGFIALDFLNLETNVYEPIPGGAIETFSDSLEFTFFIPETTHIRIRNRKSWPDNLDTLQYFFGIRELIVRKSETSFEAVLQSKSLELTPYRTEVPSVYSVQLSSKQSNQEGTKIKHFIAVDDVIPGKVLDGDGGVVSIESDDAFEFVANGTNAAGNTENFFSYATQLRDRPDISGTYRLVNWEPNWQEIGPLNDGSNDAPKALFFNTSTINEDIHDISFESPIVWDDPRYTGPWPTAQAAADGVTWATDWDGVGTMPEVGYIWGENPFKDAGIWWGDSIEYPGWWRPRVPDVSGAQTWDPTSNTELQRRSTPDYSIPVFDSNGDLVSKKEFWRVFKWPPNFQPIPGTVKLSMNVAENLINEEKSTGHLFKENRKESSVVEQGRFLGTLLKQGEYYVNVKLEEIPGFEGRKDIEVVRGSIREVSIRDFQPVDDFFVEVAADYTVQFDGSGVRANNLDFDKITAANNGVPPVITHARSSSDKGDGHFTVFLPDALESYSQLTGNEVPTIDMTFDFRYTTITEATWDTFTFVKEGVDNSETWVVINDPSGVVDKVVVDDLDDFGIAVGSKEFLDISEKITIPKGWAKVRVFTSVELNVDDKLVSKWTPKDVFLGDDGQRIPAFEQASLVKNFVSNSSMRQVDLYTLMWESDEDDDTRFAVVEDADDTSYAVVKSPSEGIFPSGLLNQLRFTRTHVDSNAPSGFVTFTTGTSGNIGNFPQAVNDDTTLDDDLTIQNRPANTFTNVHYPNISSFGATMQIDDTCGSGFLFWDTAENLETFYNIEYKLPNKNRPTQRLLYKAVLISNDASRTPVLSSYNISVNNKESVRSFE